MSVHKCLSPHDSSMTCEALAWAPVRAWAVVVFAESSMVSVMGLWSHGIALSQELASLFLVNNTTGHKAFKINNEKFGGTNGI